MEQAFTTRVARLVADRPERLGEHVEYLDEATGLLCRIVPDEDGRYFGYVAVPRDHPFHALPLDGCPVQCREPESGPCEHSPVRRLAVRGQFLQAAADGPLWWISFTLPDPPEAGTVEIAAVAQQLARLGGHVAPRRLALDTPEEHPAMALLRVFRDLSDSHHVLVSALLTADDVPPDFLDRFAAHVAERLGAYWDVLDPFLPMTDP